MLFNSVPFLVFFALTYSLYVLTLRRVKFQNVLLLLASYCFYAAWNWKFLSLIAASTLVDYVVALAIERTSGRRRRQLWLSLSICFNLGLLGFFKYYDFGIESFAALVSHFGLTPHFPSLRVVLPVGISFYTFQTMSYTIDVYRGKCRAERDLTLMALYVAFFPQLVAGPIERARHLIPQLKQPRSIGRPDLAAGFHMIVLGYFKKVVLADSLAPLVDEVFDRPSAYAGSIVLLASAGFAVQIYGDFSGYSLIARGLARLMGMELMSNFRFPYFATSPRDFWRRWHISLSSWLQEYLYFSLGGSRRGRAHTYLNLMVTMVLGGLWHGASWNFVFWGVYHGLLLVACHAAADMGWKWPRGTSQVFAVPFTFCLTLVGWILFRCSTIEQLVAVFRQLAGGVYWTAASWSFAVPVVSAFVLLQLFHAWQRRAETEFVLWRLPWPVRCGAVAFLVAAIVVVGFRPVPFIYFQF